VSILRGESSARHAIAFRSDIGLAHRSNQDAGGAWTIQRSDETAASLVAVADGVSAGQHSEEASRLTIETVRERVFPLLQDSNVSIDSMATALLEASRSANLRVARRPHVSLSNADATTLVTVCCIGDEGVGLWCGDSRVYRLTPGNTVRLTRDHSWAEEVVDQGLMSSEEAARDRRAHMITRWLGPPERDDPGIETFRFELPAGAAVMCCTDGLYGYFTSGDGASADEMADRLFAFGTDLQAGVEALVDVALERGGRDNITAGAIMLNHELERSE